MGLIFASDNVDTLVWFLLLFAVIYFCTTYTFNHWASLGVPYVPPVPLFGNSFKTALSLRPNHENILRLYNYCPDSPFIGTWNLLTPSLLIRDPFLVEQVLIKDFSIFYNRGSIIDTELDPLLANLMHLENSKWRNLRNKLTPTFSSDKLKGMHQQLVDCADMLVNYIDSNCEKNVGSRPLEIRELMAKFTIDVIGSCAFGLNTNALSDPNSEFRQIGRQSFIGPFFKRLRNTIRFQFPKLLKVLGWKSIPQKTEDFFVNAMEKTIQFREQNNIQRNDFIQLMMDIRKQDMEASNNGSKEVILDDKMMTANAFVFFVAGFETTATTLSYLLYELGNNPHIQEKLYNEVTQTIQKNKGELTFDCLKDMTYLEQVICETLRKYPPVANTRRKSLKPYNVPNSSLVLPAGSDIAIPIHGLQHDPKFFKDPEIFDPDRFSERNKDNIVKGTYLPFGDGPRICIASRFAKTEIKVAVCKLLQNYSVQTNSRTSFPLKYRSSSTFLVPAGGIWLDFMPRKHKLIKISRLYDDKYNY